METQQNSLWKKCCAINNEISELKEEKMHQQKKLCS